MSDRTQEQYTIIYPKSVNWSQFNTSSTVVPTSQTMNRTVQYILFHFNLCSPLLSTTLEHWPLSVLIFTTLLGFHSWSEYCVHNCTILNISLIHLHYAWYTLSDLLLRSTRLSIRLHAATYNQRQSHLLRRISLRPCNHYPTNIDQGARKGALSINRVLQMILTG